jgi:hypothetical protein
LLTGAAVLFNGIRVGEVVDLQLNPDNPREVTAAIAVVAGTPVRTDTRAGLEFQGLTGVPVISLLGGDAGAAPLASSKTEPAASAARSPTWPCLRRRDRYDGRETGFVAAHGRFPPASSPSPPWSGLVRRRSRLLIEHRTPESAELQASNGPEP